MRGFAIILVIIVILSAMFYHDIHSSPDCYPNDCDPGAGLSYDR